MSFSKGQMVHSHWLSDTVWRHLARLAWAGGNGQLSHGNTGRKEKGKALPGCRGVSFPCTPHPTTHTSSSV